MAEVAVAMQDALAPRACRCGIQSRPVCLYVQGSGVCPGRSNPPAWRPARLGPDRASGLEQQFMSRIGGRRG